MFNPIDALAKYLVSRLPIQRRTRELNRQPINQVSGGGLDVDTVHSFLTQADGGDPRQLLGLYETLIYGDAHLQGELGKRKLAVLGDPWSVAPADEKNAADVAAAALVRPQLTELKSFFGACSALLNGCLYPVVVIERVYRVATTSGLRYEIAELIPVHPGLLYFDFAGPLRVFDVDANGTVLPTHQMLDPLRYIVHRGHLLGDRDHLGGPMRSLVFWSLFSACDRDWWVRFLDKYGGAFMVGKYDQSDDDSRLILERAFALAQRLGGIVISKETEVEIKQALSKDAGEAFSTFHAICQEEKSKLIVGQTTSASAQSAGGLGSGIGEAQAAVRDDIRQFDRLCLANTIRHEIIAPFLAVNGLPGNVTISFGAEAPEDTEKTSRALANLANAGIEVADAGLATLGERMGLPLKRKAVTVAPPPDSPLTGLSADPLLALAATLAGEPRPLLADDANQRVARAGSADLARAFRGDLAPLAVILGQSTSATDFERRLRDAFPQWSPHRTTRLLEAGLTAMAANALPTPAD